MKKIYFLVTLLLTINTLASAQDVALKSNIFYGIYGYAPNLSCEVKLGCASSIEAGAGYNHWNWNGKRDDNKKLTHYILDLEYRYWLDYTFEGHFFGFHTIGSQYNISRHNLPMLFEKESQNYRYQGWAAGCGISYGYAFWLSKRWRLELNVGVGYAKLKYDKYQPQKCGEKLGYHTKNYFGPTKGGVSIAFLL